MKTGFTLAELLISIAILGVIATFAIPKIMASSQNGQNVTKAKEAAAMLTGAYQRAQLDGIVTASTKPSDLTPYLNYVKINTSGTVIDAQPTVSFRICAAASPCAKLHNGGVSYVLGSGYFLRNDAFKCTGDSL